MSQGRNVSFDNSLSTSYWMWRNNPALSVPTMMAASLGVMSEFILGVFGLALLIDWEHSNILARIAKDIVAPTPTNLSDVLNVLASRSFLMPLLDYMLPAVALTIVIVVLASGFVYSAEFGSYQRVLDGFHVDTTTVMAEFRRRWKAMAWTYFLSYLITFSPMVASILAAVSLFSLESTATILSSILLLFGLLGTATLAALLIYSPVAVCAEGLSGYRAVTRSASLVVRYPGVSLAYSVVYVVLTAIVTGVAGAVPGLSLPLVTLASVGVLIVVTPVLHLSKASLYRQMTTDYQANIASLPPCQNGFVAPLAGLFWRKFRMGLTQLRLYTFERSNFVYHIVAASSMFIGILTGKALGVGGIDRLAYNFGYVPGRINPLVSGSLPFTLSFFIFLHNWQVSLGTALSGVYMSVFSLGMLFMNGVIIGIVATLVPNTLMLAAALLPHGIIEVPSFVIAGSAGLKFGVSYTRTIRSKKPDEDQEILGRVATQTVYLVVGLVLLFFIAGLIEGNVTPWIMKLAGWS